MPLWKLHGDGRTVAPGAVVRPHERLTWPATIAVGLQHVIAMFGATFLVPILTGFPVSTTLLFSGVGTLLFLLITRNRLPSYLGSSFAFIAPITALNGGDPLSSPEQLTQALVGVAVAGALLVGFGGHFRVAVRSGVPVAPALVVAGVGTLPFPLITPNRLTSLLGSAVALHAPLTAVNGGDPLSSPGPLAQALVGVVVAGALLAVVGFIVQAVGTGWIEKLMPPVVAGAIVALIGFNLAPAAWHNFAQQPELATVTLAAVALFSVLFRGFLGRISIFLGLIVGYVVAAITGAVDFKIGRAHV